MRTIELLFVEIDRLWKPAEPVRIPLSIIGAGALLLQSDYERGTKDSDIFETTELSAPVQEKLLRIAGVNSDLHKRLRVFVEIVRNGLPFLAHLPRWQSADALNAQLQSFEVRALDVVDVCVSKLKRFAANDIADIDAMVERNLVAHEHFVDRFRAAVDEFAGDARADDLPTYLRNFHRVERDMFGVDETEIELPSWI